MVLLAAEQDFGTTGLQSVNKTIVLVQKHSFNKDDMRAILENEVLLKTFKSQFQYFFQKENRPEN